MHPSGNLFQSIPTGERTFSHINMSNLEWFSTTTYVAVSKLHCTELKLERHVEDTTV